MNTVLIYWVLPSLVTFLLTCAVLRHDNEPMEEWDSGMWVMVIAVCTLYPFGLLVALASIFESAADFLVKERAWRKK